MNLTTTKLNSAYKLRSKVASQASRPLLDNKTQKQLSFIGNITDSLKKFAFDNDIVYKQAKNITEAIDDVVGDGFFESQLKKSSFTHNDDVITIVDKGAKSLFLETIKYPFVELPVDILSGIAKGLDKCKLEGASKAITDIPFVKTRLNKVEVEKANKFVYDVLTQFAPEPEKLANKGNIEDLKEAFTNIAAKSITTPSKNYLSRDERTLNRMATATVSALYGAHDFYNISMLQKNDKKEAKKAEKQRFSQEMTRMLISASLTFFSLGVLDKFTKKNLVLNASVIALSSLISEVASRLINGVPLRPLSPEDAKKVAQKRKAKKEKAQQTQAKQQDSVTKENKPQQNTTQQNTTQQTQNAQKVGFKSKCDTNKLYINFTKNGVNPAIEKMNDNNSAVLKAGELKQEKKKMSLKKAFLLALGACNLIYFLNRGNKANFKYNSELEKLFKEEKINIFAEKPKVTKEAISNINDIYNRTKHKAFDKTTIGKGFDDVKKILTEKRTEVTAGELTNKINKLLENEEGQQIEPILRRYKKYIEELGSKKAREKSEKLGKKVAKEAAPLTLSGKRGFSKGLYDGVTKIFKTVYQILSAPMALVLNQCQKKIDPNIKFAEKYLNKSKEEAQLKQLSELHAILEKNKNNPKKAIEIIKSNVRNFEVSSETSELANFSRTLVTMISTYFFVNDYSNKVLIESEGKDVDRAKGERNDRIAHKMSNFVINGTLMNTFNSIGKSLLNRSLIGATLIAAMTETTNEFLVRKSICQPVTKMNSKEDIIKYEEKQLNNEGLMGSWSRFFRKITGKKTLTQKAGIDNKKA